MAFASKAFLKSDMCRHEITASMRASKPVLVLRFTNLSDNHWLTPVIRSRQWIQAPPKDPFAPKETGFRAAFRKAIRDAHRSAHGA